MMPLLPQSRPAPALWRDGGKPPPPDNGFGSNSRVWSGFAASGRVPGRIASLPPRRDELGTDGVQLPLLAPMLSGLSLRAGRTGPEFILPNPSGGRGVYVASWTVVTGFATPSLHDTLLVGLLSGQDRIEARAVREAARQVAHEGHAGPEAAEAARAVQAALRLAALRLRAKLLMSLARRAGFNRPEQAARCLSRQGFDRLALLLGWHAPALAEALRAVSDRYATVAIGDGLEDAVPCSDRAVTGGHGRWGRLAVLVRRLRTGLAVEQCNFHGQDGAALARIIGAADRCLRAAGAMLPEIAAMLDDPTPLLEAWRDRDERDADWLLGLEAAFDGWARVCLLWFDADTRAQREAAINEMAILTRTVGGGDTRAAADQAGDQPDRTRLLLRRNERLRARELLLDAGAA